MTVNANFINNMSVKHGRNVGVSGSRIKVIQVLKIMINAQTMSTLNFFFTCRSKR